ncbi:hypothetical protein LOK49_LG13G00138 [Camellia lanceoleosa]|uniref:Uncharacterized protein n=1 Tax=Camellia lanceoleosa TaxID=1840588 RepID=A0ACC0FIU0_9ERIC|nr:hypothetical protein LOK49_LG13G00138 [Camellia lanceoleosa]
MMKRGGGGGERELYYVFESGVVENVGVHVVYKEAEEQALSRVVYTTTLKKMIKEDHLNSKRLRLNSD